MHDQVKTLPAKPVAGAARRDPQAIDACSVTTSGRRSRRAGKLLGIFSGTCSNARGLVRSGSAGGLHDAAAELVAATLSITPCKMTAADIATSP